MDELKIKSNYKKNYIITAKLFLLHVFIFHFNTLVGFFVMQPVRDSVKPNVTKGFVFGTNLVFFQNNAIVYMIVIYAIHDRLSLVQVFLESLKNDCEVTEKEVVRKLRRISVFIDKIGDTLDTMKICYTILIFIAINYFTFYTILSIYGSISFAFIHSSYLDFAFCCVTLVWEFYYAPFFFWIFMFSSLIQREAKEIQLTVSKIAVKWRNKKICRRANLINMQLSHRRLLIECALFLVNWKFFFTFIGICFSYLVIIIQFELKDI